MIPFCAGYVDANNLGASRPMKFRKKPVVIEALQWFKMGDHPAVVPAFRNAHGSIDMEPLPSRGQVPTFAIDTLEAKHEVTPGDWIIKGIKGEFYPCKPDIFQQTYEPVVDEAANG